MLEFLVLLLLKWVATITTVATLVLGLLAFLALVLWAGDHLFTYIVRMTGNYRLVVRAAFAIRRHIKDKANKEARK